MTQIRTLLHFRPAGLEDLLHIERLRQERWVLLCQSDARYHQQQPGDIRGWMTSPDCHIWVGEKSAPNEVLPTSIVGYLTAWQNTSPYGDLPPHIILIDELALDAHKYHAGLGRGLVEQIRLALPSQPTTRTTRIIACVPRYHAVEQAFWRALGAAAFERTAEADFITTPPPTSLWMTL